MSGSSSRGIPMREMLVFYYKYRWRLYAAFIPPFLIMLMVGMTILPKYTANTVLVVRLGSEYVYQPEVGGSQTTPNSTIPFDREQIYKSEVAILNSDDIHQQIIETIGLENLYPKIVHPDAMAQAMTNFRQMVSQAITGKPPIQLGSEELYRRMLAEALEQFDKSASVELERESAVINVSFQHPDRELALKVTDEWLKQYMERRKTLFQENRVQLAQEQASITQRKSNSAQAALENYKREHKIYAIDAQRTALLEQREVVRKQMTTLSNPTYEGRYQSILDQLDELDHVERQYKLLEHEAQIASDEFGIYSHKLEEARAYDNMERERVGSVRVIQPPSAMGKPKGYRSLFAMGGIFLGFIFMIINAILIEAGRSGFLTPERLETAIGLPVLATIPKWR